MRNYLSVFVISFLVVLLDQLTKWLVKAHVPFLSRINVFSWFDITHLRNPGIAFGMLRDMSEDVRLYFYIVVFVLVLVAVFFFLRRLEEEQRIFRYALAFVLGGSDRKLNRQVCLRIRDRFYRGLLAWEPLICSGRLLTWLTLRSRSGRFRSWFPDSWGVTRRVRCSAA